MSHYETMGLDPSAAGDEIRDRYRDLVKVVHPDVGGDRIMFEILCEAYDVLSDPASRRRYDSSIRLVRRPEMQAPPPPRAPIVPWPQATARSNTLFDVILLYLVTAGLPTMLVLFSFIGDPSVGLGVVWGVVAVLNVAIPWAGYRSWKWFWGRRVIPPAAPRPERWCDACGGARSGSCSTHSGGRCDCPRS